MNKRKNDIYFNIYDPILSNRYKIYDKYENLLNCDQILLRDNHISFNSLINQESIGTLITFINNIINNKHLFDDFKIYLHIKSKGGVFNELINFITFKTQCIYEIVSIIDNECYDSGFILAALCSYRIITKNAKVYLSEINIAKNGDCYWNYFNQCSNEETNNFKILLYDILCNVVESNLTSDKLDSYFQKKGFHVWNSKKYKKLGFADEII